MDIYAVVHVVGHTRFCSFWEKEEDAEKEKDILNVTFPQGARYEVIAVKVNK